MYSVARRSKFARNFVDKARLVLQISRFIRVLPMAVEKRRREMKDGVFRMGGFVVRCCV